MPTKKQTKRILRISLLVATVISLFFVPWMLIRAWIMPLPHTVQEQLNEGVRYGMDGIIVYVDQKGQPPALYAAGWKNREDKIPANPHALFKIASISKLYIAVAATRLVANHTLSLDATLTHLLPETARRIEYADQITLRLLLQHRSGIPNFIDQPSYSWIHPPDNEETLALILDKPADFKPNARYAYSNTNYLLIGRILDRTLGYSHHEYIRTEILEPLGLSHTFGRLSDVNPNDMMSGYVVGYRNSSRPNDFSVPGGSMVATAQDVGIFLRALNDGSLLTDNEQAIYSSMYKYEHTGLLPGYQSIARYHKDIDAVVVQFVSTSGGTMWNLAEIVYNRIVKILKQNKRRKG
jgi:D-alanyl-D-alanine carboxypeptidase